jgi:hypothetical protein
MDPIMQKLGAFFHQHAGCHTVLLYGSRALDTAREDSDWNVIAMHDGTAIRWHHGEVSGVGFVNATLYPTKSLEVNMEGMLGLRAYAPSLSKAIVLVEREGWGERIIARAQELATELPEPPMPTFRDMVQRYYRDRVLAPQTNMALSPLSRAAYRHEGLIKSLNHYFTLRSKRLPAFREALEYMATEDPQAHALYAAALRPDASVEALSAWLDRVLAT